MKVRRWLMRRLPDGSRVNAVIAPVSLSGTLVSIRKFREDPFQMEDLLEFNSLNEAMAGFLQGVVKAKDEYPHFWRYRFWEDDTVKCCCSIHSTWRTGHHDRRLRRIALGRPNVVGMEARPANVEGRGEVTIRNLVRNALRMRPDESLSGRSEAGKLSICFRR